MHQRSGILIILAICGLMACQPEEERPNIILMMADDLGWGDTGFNGNTQISTPNMDKLAGQGIIFNRFYSASPVCSPTRASCLTGRNPYRMGIPTANSGHLPKSENSLAEILKEAGYATGHFGKWHLGAFTSKLRDANRGKPGDTSHISIPTDHGFDEFFSTESKVPTWDPMIRPASFDTAQGEGLRYGWTAPVSGTDSIFYQTRYWNAAEEPVFDNVKGDDSRVIMDRAVDFIERSIANSSPFFTVIWFHAPHLPVVVPEEYKSRFSNESNPIQLYYGSISALDEQIGRLWNTLKSNNADSNTIIFFCSDNGPENRTPGSAGSFRGRKRDLYEGGVRVPAFIVWADKIEAGTNTDFPAFTTDYLPTIVDLLDLSYSDPEHILDGTSLNDAIYGKELIRDKPMGFLYPGKMSWVSHQYKLISKDKGESFELYDLLKDPGESEDLLDQLPEVADKMKVELESWRKSCLDDQETGEEL